MNISKMYLKCLMLFHSTKTVINFNQSSITYGNKYLKGYLGRDPSDTGWGLKFDFIIIHESHDANNIHRIADMEISQHIQLDYLENNYTIGTRKGIQNQTNTM